MYRYIIETDEQFFREVQLWSEKSDGEVVIVVPRPYGKVLLMTKGFYPDGVYRLPTGKMKKGESPEQAIYREVWEETGHNASSRLMDTFVSRFKFGDQVVDYPSYVFAVEQIDGQIAPIDTDEGITGFREIDPSELKAIAAHLRTLPDPWTAWGEWRAAAHDLVHEALCKDDEGQEFKA